MADDETTEDDDEKSPAEKQLWRHRYEVASKAGLGHFDASKFADEGIDTHALSDLTAAGCDPATALRILLL